MRLEKEKIDMLKGLDDEDLTLKEISHELDEPVEKVREAIIEKADLSEKLKDKALESKAFEMFEGGKDPGELVKSGLCSSEKAVSLLQEYSDLTDQKEVLKEDDVQEKLATQIGLLGSRLSKLEIKIMDSALLPKSFECPSCGQEGRYNIAMICRRCESIASHPVESYPEISQEGNPLTNFVAEENDEENEEEEEGK